MKRHVHPLVSVLVLLCLCAGVFSGYCPVHAEEEEPVLTLSAKYDSLVTSDAVTLEVPYSDAWFHQPATSYNHDLARASLGLTLASFRPFAEKEEANSAVRAKTFLEQAGFHDFHSDNYDRPTGRYTIASAMAMKTIQDEDEPFTLIAVGIAGQGYAAEWLSNLTIGNGDVHKGFKEAADEVYNRLFGYIAANHIEKPYKIWISGFSRSAAITNILAARLEQDQILADEDVFAYTFATPRTTKITEEGRHDNIFNIVGGVDPVPQIPFRDWDFDRYGITFYTPAQETSSRWHEMEKKADAVYQNLVGLELWNNPVINGQIKVLTEYLLEICPNNQVYTDHLQDRMLALWSSHTPIEIMRTLIDISHDTELITPQNQDEANSLLDFALYNFLDYLMFSDTMGYMENRASTAANIMHEHTPDVYAAWMMSDTPPEQLFTENRSYCRMIMEGMADVIITDAETKKPVQTIDSEGNITFESKNTELFANRAITKTAVIFPRDHVYDVTIVPKDSDTITVTYVDYTSEQTRITKYHQMEYQPQDLSEIKLCIDGHTHDSNNNLISSTEVINTIRDNSSPALSSIQKYEQLNIFNLSWRNFSLFVLNGAFFLIAISLFVLLYSVGKMRWLYRRNTGYYDPSTKYYGLPLFLLCTVFVFFFTQEFHTALFPEDPLGKTWSKLVIGAMIIFVACHGYRHVNSRLNFWNIPVLVLLTAADLLINYASTPAIVLRMIAMLILIYAFFLHSRPLPIQGAVFAVLFLMVFYIIHRLKMSINFTLNAEMISLIFLNMLSPAVIACSLPMPNRYRNGAWLLCLSGLLMILNAMHVLTFTSHIVAAGIYYLGTAMLAGASVKLIPSKKFAPAPKMKHTAPSASQ